MKTECNINRPRILFGTLVILSIISTMHLLLHDFDYAVISDGLFSLDSIEHLQLKEVSFVDFLVQTVQRIFIHWT